MCVIIILNSSHFNMILYILFTYFNFITKNNIYLYPDSYDGFSHNLHKYTMYRY